MDPYRQARINKIRQFLSPDNRTTIKELAAAMSISNRALRPPVRDMLKPENTLV